MALFYGVYLKDRSLSTALDYIRLLAEPKYFRRTHVTVRGPYKRKLNLHEESELNKKFRRSGEILEIDGVGCFYEGDQSTIYLKCAIPGVMSVWRKPDFRNSFPHITLYDGNDRAFAEELKKIVSAVDWKFSVYVTGIRLIVSKRESNSIMEVLWEEPLKVGNKFVDGSKLLEIANCKNKNERLEWIKKLCEVINAKYVVECF